MCFWEFHYFHFIFGWIRSPISGNCRHSYFIISVSFLDDSVVLFPEILSFIFHYFRFISGLFRRFISGNFRHSYFIISVSFPIYSIFPKFPSCRFDYVLFSEISIIQISSFPIHCRMIPSSYFRKFRRSYFIISSELFHHLISGNFVIHISLFPFYFWIILSSSRFDRPHYY